METVGKFEFNRKDLIGHGAFAVVFRGRHKEKHDLEVAVKCINKKNLAKSQSLLGKEIKILKELKHDNIVGLLDFQEISGCVYLVMEYCNGGDLAEYLHSKGTLSEDTLRVFLQQIAGAMSVLRSKGIIHRDLKPQNILLSYPTGRKANPNNICIKIGKALVWLSNLTDRKANPNNICIKIADFGFARYLQGNTMAATLCGSPMYMAPEVITSQNYDAKADLWSVGTIVYQCLTGKAPFQANSPQELRLFYERNRNLSPSIPRETSSHLRQLLLGLLQRNHKDRMDFDEFFHHPFLEASSSGKTSPPVAQPSYPSSGSGSSCSSSSTLHLTPTQSEAEPQKPLPLSKATPPESSLRDFSSSEADDFVMVPAQFTSETGGTPTQDSMMHSGHVELCVSSYSQSVPIPVPTQIHNYQRMEQNLQESARAPGATPSPRRLSIGGCRPYQPSPQAGIFPEMPGQTGPLGTTTGLQGAALCPQHQQQGLVSPALYTDPRSVEMALPCRQRSPRQSPDSTPPKFDLRRQPGSQALGTALAQQGLTLMPGRTRTVPNLAELARCQGTMPHPSNRVMCRKRSSLKRSVSTGRLSDMLLKAVFGAQLDRGSSESLNTERPMDTTGPHGSPSGVVFTLGSSPSGHPPSQTTHPRRYSVGSSNPYNPDWPCSCQGYDTADNHRYGYRDPTATNLHGGIAFEPPELPEETLMEQGHVDALGHLRFALAFVHCVMEIAAAKDCGIEEGDGPDASFLQQSLLADQISLLSREWSAAEQLVLYLKCAELLSSELHSAMQSIKQGKLYPSITIKQVVRKLNEQYKSCVTACRSLSARLQIFFSSKQRLMDRFNSTTAERLIYTHTVHMVQSAALDEMFHHSQASVQQRYHRALLLLEGLSLIVTQHADIHNINKCKQCIERRLSSLQARLCV